MSEEFNKKTERAGTFLWFLSLVLFVAALIYKVLSWKNNG